MTDPRPGWEKYFLGIADAVSLRADCTRRKVGAVIVDQDGRIVSAGYNGAPTGRPGCLSAGACPRGKHWQVASVYRQKFCACGAEWPCPSYLPAGSSYDTGPGTCIAVHAEANALLYARASVKNCTIYVTDAPCDGCSRLIEAAGVGRAIYYDYTKQSAGEVMTYHYGVGW